jgi:hypothetical protein
MLLAAAPRLSDYRTTSAAEPRAHQGHVAAVRWSGPAITTRAQWPRPRAPEASGQPARLPARCGEGLDAPEVAVRDLLGQIQVAQTRRRSSSRGPPGARTVRKRPSQAFASPALGGTWPAGTSDGSASRAAQSMRTSRARRPTSCRSSRLSAPSSSAESPASLASRSAHVSGPLPGSVTERPLRCRSRASMTGAASSRIFARKGRTPPGWRSSIPYHCHRSGHGKGYSSPRRSSAAAQPPTAIPVLAFDVIDPGPAGRYCGQECRLPLKLIDQRIDIGQAGLRLASERVRVPVSIPGDQADVRARALRSGAGTLAITEGDRIRRALRREPAPADYLPSSAA